MTTFDSILATLLKHPSPLLPFSSPLPLLPYLTPQIASFLLHPTLEAALHILNHDLTSAHFLVRHMQSAPAHEGMYVHGILHRIEGDYDNARMWYSDVRGAEVYRGLWGEQGVGWKEWIELREEEKKDKWKDGGQVFLDEVQSLREAGKSRSSKTRVELEEKSRREIEHVINFCKAKFGTKKYEDASSAWVKNNEEISKMSQDQVNGNSGHRKF